MSGTALSREVKCDEGGGALKAMSEPGEQTDRVVRRFHATVRPTRKAHGALNLAGFV